MDTSARKVRTFKRRGGVNRQSKPSASAMQQAEAKLHERAKAEEDYEERMKREQLITQEELWIIYESLVLAHTYAGKVSVKLFKGLQAEHGKFRLVASDGDVPFNLQNSLRAIANCIVDNTDAPMDICKWTGQAKAFDCQPPSLAASE